MLQAMTESTSRALPKHDFMEMLSAKVGFDASGDVHQALHRGFGKDASTKVRNPGSYGQPYVPPVVP